jgi:hypothetical protein
MLIIEITLSGIFCLDNASKEMLWPRAVVARWSKRLDLMLERSNNLSTMRRRSKNVVAYVLAAFFAFGILCSALAAPGQALASVSGCSQMLGGMAMTGCEHPSYLCGFDTGSNLFSSGALTSARLSDSLKNALGLALDAPSIDVSGNFAPPGARQWKKVSLTEPDKVSIRLFNSTLNL